MRYHITHRTTYTYHQPVTLAPHRLRLRPRCDVTQRLVRFSLEIDPVPIQLSENIDLDGNTVLTVWFADTPTTTFAVISDFEVETYRSNPFAFLLEDWATQLPMDYSSSLAHQLTPYLGGAASNFPAGLDPIAVQLAHDLWQQTSGNTLSFLSKLNQLINHTCKHLIRETGDPFPPSLTWTQQAGSCRDMTILFMDVCRAMGLATRFVSGYQEGDPDWSDRHLHAWAEVYLPGAGWRGYDPTQGLAVGDRHIALVASPSSRHTAPISGSLKSGGGTKAEMGFKLTIQPLGTPFP